MTANNNSTSDVITGAVSEQNKYIEVKIQEAIANLSVSPTMVLGTQDSGVLNAIWIDQSS